MVKSHSILQYDKVKDLYDNLGTDIVQDDDFSIHRLTNLHKTAPYRSPVFRANYYSFVFIKQGKGNYSLDEKKFEYGSRTLYFTNPGHLKSFEMYQQNNGYLITMNEGFFKRNVHEKIFREFPFLLAEIVPPQRLKSIECPEYERIFHQITDEFTSESLYKYRIIGNLMVVLLLKIKERFWSDYHPISEGDRSSQIVKEFKNNLEKHFLELSEKKVDIQYQVRDFANLQYLNPSYFSTVISSKTGRSIRSWINEKAINQAKALMQHSNLSIKEIGCRLGYSETSHFSNFFKKQTGFSPTQFRKSHSI